MRQFLVNPKRDVKKVLFGIQCRSRSTRLPGKCLLKIGGKSIIEHVVAQTKNAANFVNRNNYQAKCETQLLVPRNDMPLINHMSSAGVEIIEGPELDVLSRYIKAANAHGSDYIVRITGDCLYIPPFSISRHVKYALRNQIDYCNNILIRMNPEGYDTEVISKNLLHYLDTVCTKGEHREHVTSIIPQLLQEKHFVRTFKIASSVESLDLSHIKTSIDTQEDYEFAVKNFEKIQSKIEKAMVYGEVF